MKRKFTNFSFLLICLTYVMSSCKKEANTEIQKDGNLYDVSFKIDGYTKEVSSMGPTMSVGSKGTGTPSVNASPINAVQSYLKAMDFFLYDANGDLVDHRHQDNNFEGGTETSPYGATNYKLTTGSYKIIVIGSMGGLKFPDSTKYQTAALVPEYTVEDIFYKELSFNVDETENINETITIERIVGYLDVRQREQVTPLWGGPPRVFYYTVTRYPFDSSKEHTVTMSYDLPHISGDVIPSQTVDFVTAGFILPDRSGSFNANVVIFIPAIRSGGEVASRIFDDIIIKPNEKVVLKGTLTGTGGQQYFEVNADSTWQNTVTHEFRQND